MVFDSFTALCSEESDLRSIFMHDSFGLGAEHKEHSEGD